MEDFAMVKRIGILTSGGDAPGMNAAVRAVVRAGIDSGLETYAIYNGYLGLFKGQIERMYRKSVSDKLRLGGTFLGTARLPEFKEKEIREQAIENLTGLTFAIPAHIPTISNTGNGINENRKTARMGLRVNQEKNFFSVLILANSFPLRPSIYPINSPNAVPNEPKRITKIGFRN